MTLYTVKTIARVLDLSERRVRQLRDEGVIGEYKCKAGLYDLVPTVQKYINFLRSGKPDGEGGVNYHTERALFMRAKRQDVEFELGLKEGNLHTSEDVRAVIASVLTNFKSRIMAMPSKLAPVLSKKTKVVEIKKIIKAACDEALNELAELDNAFVTEESCNAENNKNGNAENEESCNAENNKNGNAENKESNA